MPGKFHHEQFYRTGATLSHLAKMRVTLCGAGAVGSLLADNLARHGVAHLRAIDFDRIEEHNVSTQLYAEAEVGSFKVDVLRNRLFRATGIEMDAVRKELTAANARVLLKESDLVIDAFDNSASRRIVQECCRAGSIACLHVGLAADYAEVIWDERYHVPADAGQDICDYPLARNLVLLAVAVASESVVAFAADGQRNDWSMTLRDLSIRVIG